MHEDPVDVPYEAVEVPVEELKAGDMLAVESLAPRRIEAISSILEAFGITVGNTTFVVYPGETLPVLRIVEPGEVKL